ncbi:hypothetical protein HDA32_005656 [Spinactinospora alkalitolerans]|uniref:Uncharacterized protein n=1 Tax=Spinactinospora alkalitolerans TaxID=687207 RepID=A0A852U110_9ACTN|nr:hypothetical protein [Spinactinospora alkalitolerans]NYE50536.1 hypothetical protein [Spinactinospora alkalitolerans]
MAFYRIRMTNGSTRTQQALRVRTDAHSLYLENRSAGAWRPVLDVRLDEVEQLQRRFTENNGSWVWISEALPAPAGVHARP